MDRLDPLLPPEAGPPHWSGTESAKVVATLPFRDVAAGVTALSQTGGLMVVDGPPGVGKTFAVNLAVRPSARDVFWLTMPHQPRGKETSARVHQQLTGRRAPIRRVTEYELLEENLELLRQRGATLVIDEGQHLNRASFSQLGYLLDLSQDLLLLVVGAGVLRAMNSMCEELVNRADRQIPFGALTAKATRDAMRQYHPVFARSAPEAMGALYRAAGGVFRNWARLLKAAIALGLDDVSGPDEAAMLIRAVYGSTGHRHSGNSTKRAAA